jgi:hypothetical protein
MQALSASSQTLMEQREKASRAPRVIANGTSGSRSISPSMRGSLGPGTDNFLAAVRDISGQSKNCLALECKLFEKWVDPTMRKNPNCFELNRCHHNTVLLFPSILMQQHMRMVACASDRCRIPPCFSLRPPSHRRPTPSPGKLQEIYRH